mgnify:CR=1 FL=1
MTAALTHPVIIQGGMGVGVSDWVLARAVSLRGQLGVVSGTALDSLFVRRLQDGDVGGHLRRAMEQFPVPGVSAEVMRRYFLPEGRPPGAPYKPVPMYKQVVSRVRHQLTMLANFCEVWLAKEGHDGKVGINLLTKVQMPNLGSLYGAMLAGVDYVLMGAGIPREVPGALDLLARHEAAALQKAVQTGLPCPEVVAFDEHAETGGVPLLLMTCLPGHIVLQPADMDNWLYQQAEALVKIHATPLDESYAWAYFPWGETTGQRSIRGEVLTPGEQGRRDLHRLPPVDRAGDRARQRPRRIAHFAVGKIGPREIAARAVGEGMRPGERVRIAQEGAHPGDEPAHVGAGIGLQLSRGERCGKERGRARLLQAHVDAEDRHPVRAHPGLGIPVGERAGRVVLPDPGVQHPQTESLVAVERHAVELRGRRGRPRRERDGPLDADEAHAAVLLRLVQQQLGRDRVHDGVEAREIAVVEAHAARAGLLHTAGDRVRPQGGLRRLDVVIRCERRAQCADR